jgi:cytochrome c biogenesis protein CcmG/thiol:disulfide interchange protein DsbE
MSDQSSSVKAASGGLSRRWLFIVPVAVFAVVAAALAVALLEGRDPSLVPSALLGKPAPQFDLPEVPGFGPGVTSEDLKGQVSLVNVFASWCVSCRIEHPLLMDLGQQGEIAIYGLDYKDQPEDAAGWLADHGNPYTATGMDLDGRVGIEWGVYGVPETFVVDANGEIVYKHIGPITPEAWQDKILPIVEGLQK